MDDICAIYILLRKDFFAEGWNCNMSVVPASYSFDNCICWRNKEIHVTVCFELKCVSLLVAGSYNFMREYEYANPDFIQNMRKVAVNYGKKSRVYYGELAPELS